MRCRHFKQIHILGGCSLNSSVFAAYATSQELKLASETTGMGENHVGIDSNLITA